MDPATMIILADGLATLSIRLVQAFQAMPETTEEQKAQIEALRQRLLTTLSQVEAYRPLPTEE